MGKAIHQYHQGTKDKPSITTNLNRLDNEKAAHGLPGWLADCGRQISFFECWGVRIMCASKNSQIQRICISGALFLFYAPKILKHQKIILSFPSYHCFDAKIPHRSAGFLPASFFVNASWCEWRYRIYPETQSYQRFAGNQAAVFA